MQTVHANPNQNYAHNGNRQNDWMNVNRWRVAELREKISKYGWDWPRACARASSYVAQQITQSIRYSIVYRMVIRLMDCLFSQWIAIIKSNDWCFVSNSWAIDSIWNLLFVRISWWFICFFSVFFCVCAPNILSYFISFTSSSTPLFKTHKFGLHFTNLYCQPANQPATAASVACTAHQPKYQSSHKIHI